jgi:hypothetical protein
VWAVGWLVGGSAQPSGGQPPPDTFRPPPGAAGRANATRQPRVVGLLATFGDALVGHRLAQPGMLVVHGPSPFLQLSRVDCCRLA